MIFFFFSSRRRHTRWPRDWSSDVCSSDLVRPGTGGRPSHPDLSAAEGLGCDVRRGRRLDRIRLGAIRCAGRGFRTQIGRASCRERGEVEGGGGALKKRRKKEETEERHQVT